MDASISKYKTQEDFGKLYAYTYDQLVRVTEKRLFNLKYFRFRKLKKITILKE